MKFYTILTSALFFLLVVSINSAYAQVDPLTDLTFLQTGELATTESKFQISNEIAIREFFNGNIVRVSGQTVEGFPYITYSKVLEDRIDTHGKIFINNKFVELDFEQKIEENIQKEKDDNLLILTKYSQYVYSKQEASISIKVFEPEVNTKNDFELNDGLISNVSIQVSIMDGDNEIFSDEGVTNEKGFFESEFTVPVDRINTYTLTINAETEESNSTKILQIFNRGTDPADRSD